MMKNQQYQNNFFYWQVMYYFVSGNHDHWRLYEYIVQHFLASISPDCVYLQTEINFLIGEEKFHCIGTSPIKPGFTQVNNFTTF